MLIVLGQIASIIAVIFSFLSYQAKTPKKLLFLHTSSIVALLIGYFLIGATSGGVLNVICLLRNIVYYNRSKKPFSHPCVPYVFAALLAIFGAFSWQGPISLCIIIALMINTVALSLGDNQKLRKSILLTSTLVLIYNIFVFSIGGILNESVVLASAIIGLVRFRKANDRPQ